MSFSWHQDSGYLGFPHTPHITCWTAVDDMTLDNGTAHIMLFSRISIRKLVEHEYDERTGDKAGYFGNAPGVPAIAPAGSVVVFSSLSFHRSGTNITNQMRRAYVTQYSPKIIYRQGETEPMHLGVPFLENGHIICNS